MTYVNVGSSTVINVPVWWGMLKVEEVIYMQGGICKLSAPSLNFVVKPKTALKNSLTKKSDFI